jgi:hypothetical protein
MKENLFPIAATATLLVALLLSLAWVGHDAKIRGRSPLRIMLLCFITWPLGFLIWRGVRPPPPL